ncbi:MAG: hypothetical protein JNK27_16810 [Chitinophagaceae bacterium]|nr:hypothetical protein [Chitinophagaceae bacterium]
MTTPVHINYFHPGYQIGLEDVKNAWLFCENKSPVKLKTIMYQGLLAYRLPVSGKRISYRNLKRGLTKKNFTFHREIFLLPF